MARDLSRVLLLDVADLVLIVVLMARELAQDQLLVLALLVEECKLLDLAVPPQECFPHLVSLVLPRARLPEPHHALDGEVEFLYTRLIDEIIVVIGDLLGALRSLLKVVLQNLAVPERKLDARLKVSLLVQGVLQVLLHLFVLFEVDELVGCYCVLTFERHIGVQSTG